MSLDLSRLPHALVRNALRLADSEDGVVPEDPDHYDVGSIKSPTKRVGVHRGMDGDGWRCTDCTDKGSDDPCGHILAVMLKTGEVERAIGSRVWQKGDDGRNWRAEEEAWRLVPTMLPKLAADLVREGLVAFQPERGTAASEQGAQRVEARGGRPRKPLYPQAYQALMRVAFRESLRSSQGSMRRHDHQEHNPWGPCGRSTITRFLADPETTTLLEKLLALSTWPARAYESIFHADATGLTEERFTQYFDEKRVRELRALARKGQKKKRDGSPITKQDMERRVHAWNYAEFLWTYRYTLIAAAYTQRQSFGEPEWLLPLLHRARMVFDVRVVGGDKAYVAHYLYEYAALTGLDVQVILKENASETSDAPQGYKQAVRESKRDPKGYDAKVKRRSNAEAGNHALKSFLGDQIYSRNPVAQRNEILCMCIAYNLTRLIYMGVKEGVEIRFAEGARELAGMKWVSLEELHDTMTVARSKTRRLGAVPKHAALQSDPSNGTAA